MKYPVRVSGNITWLVGDGSEWMSGTIVGIVRSTKELVFDCRDHVDPGWPVRYTATLMRSEAGVFEGQLVCSEGGPIPPGNVRCRLYRNSTGFALIGTWFEEGVRYEWFAELIPDDLSAPG